MELGEIGRAPVAPKQLAQNRPSKLCQGTCEENVACILRCATKGTETIGRAVSSQDLLPRWQLIQSQLPGENLDFKWDFGVPHVFVMGDSRALGELSIHRFDRVRAILLQVPGDLVKAIVEEHLVHHALQLTPKPQVFLVKRTPEVDL
jgi:hypothetical protein